MNNHWYNEGKEYLRKDDKFDYQGRSKKQVESSTVGCFIGGIGMFVVLIWLAMASLQYMDGEEIIERLKKVKLLISKEHIDSAQLEINYLIDDLFLYRKQCL